MKRPLNIYDATTLTLSYVWFTGQGYPFHWAFIFLPWAFEAMKGVFKFFFRIAGIEEDLSAWIIKMMFRLKANIIKRKIIRESKKK